MYLATEALIAYGSQEQKDKWLPLLAVGEAIGTFALSEGNGRPSVKSLTTRMDDSGLNGRKLPVADGRAADFAIVVGASDAGDGASWYLVELDQAGVSREAVRTLDFSRGHAVLEFKNAEAELLGGEGAGWSATERLLDRAAVLFAWEQVGLADAAMIQARDYAMGRYAFGRAIASYQAIKHKLANMYVRTPWLAATVITELGLLIQTALSYR